MKKIDAKKVEQYINSEKLFNFIVVSAHDRYLLESVVSHVKRSDDFSSITFDLQNLDKDYITEAIESFGFAIEKKLIILNEFNVIFNKNSDNEKFLIETLSDVPEHVTVIATMCFEDKRSTIPKKLMAFLESVENCSLISFEPLTAALVAKEITDFAKGLGVGFEAGVAQEIAMLCSLDINQAICEVQKLAALSGYTEIAKKHVEKLGIKNIESSVFDMISALERKNISKALLVLKDMLDMRTEPLMITAALNTAYVNLYRAKIASGHGKGETDLFKHFDYKKGDKKVSIAFSRVRGYSLKSLKKIIDVLMQLDMSLKSSTVDKKLILEINIIKLASFIN